MSLRPYPQPSGNILREMRLERKISQFHLAIEIGTSTACISHWETGKKVPTLRSAKRLARFYGCKLDDFFELTIGIKETKPRQKGHPS